MGIGRKVSVGGVGLALTFVGGYATGATTARHPDTIPNLRDQVQRDTGTEGDLGFRLPFEIERDPDPITGE